MSQLRRYWVLGVLGVLLWTAGCLGPNNTTARLAHWNGSFENKWSQEGIFLLCLPVYVIVSLGDTILFNSIYWWTGNNPIDPPAEHTSGTFGV